MGFNWHARFVQQAHWTEPLRRYLYPRAGLPAARRVIEIGCGTGVLTAELASYTPAASFGIDIDYARLQQARANDPHTAFLNGDASRLPFADGQFDLVFCHYFLLWLPAPLQAVQEMRRITRPGGSVLALAEPDYEGRIDYPGHLEQTARVETEALRRQGADPQAGRKLAATFSQAGLTHVEAGILGGQWAYPVDPALISAEQDTLANDLGQALTESGWSAYIALDQHAWDQGERVLFVPTFYAWGRVP